MNNDSPFWNVILVEDEENIRQQIIEYFADIDFCSKKLKITPYGNLKEAIHLIKEQKADLVILDIYEGPPSRGGILYGDEILENIKKHGFVCLVFYTALPEKVEDYTSKFVRLVGKTQGLAELHRQIAELFDLHIPQITRKIYDYIDNSLCSYMWSFAEKHWDDLAPLARQPEFMRIILNRIAVEVTSDDIVNAAEYYIVPPISKYPLLGDIRKRTQNGTDEFLVLIWPSCDLVEDSSCEPPREPKTKSIIALKAERIEATPEFEKWQADSTNGRGHLEKLMKNTRKPWKDKGISSPDRYHYLPGIWNIPHLILDFQCIEFIELAAFKQYEHLANLISPYAEELSNRFL